MRVGLFHGMFNKSISRERRGGVPGQKWGADGPNGAFAEAGTVVPEPPG